jgi:hypothetical protein
VAKLAYAAKFFVARNFISLHFLETASWLVGVGLAKGRGWWPASLFHWIVAHSMALCLISFINLSAVVFFRASLFVACVARWLALFRGFKLGGCVRYKWLVYFVAEAKLARVA